MIISLCFDMGMFWTFSEFTIVRFEFPPLQHHSYLRFMVMEVCFVCFFSCLLCWFILQGFGMKETRVG